MTNHERHMCPLIRVTTDLKKPNVLLTEKEQLTNSAEAVKLTPLRPNSVCY